MFTQKTNSKQTILYMLCIAGILVSMYLSYTKVTSSSIVCGYEGCNKVQASKYSEIFGIPMGFFGIGFYFVLFALLNKGKAKLAKYLLLWGIAYSSYLTYLEIFVIKAICAWCVSSFVIIILLSILVFTSKGTLPENAQESK